MRPTDKEDAVLSAFLYANDSFEADDAFLLDPDVFTGNFRKRIAELINIETSTDKWYDALRIDLESKCAGKGEMEYLLLEILAQTPMTLKRCARLHAELEKEYAQKIVKGVIQ